MRVREHVRERRTPPPNNLFRPALAVALIIVTLVRFIVPFLTTPPDPSTAPEHIPHPPTTPTPTTPPTAPLPPPCAGPAWDAITPDATVHDGSAKPLCDPQVYWAPPSMRVRHVDTTTSTCPPAAENWRGEGLRVVTDISLETEGVQLLADHFVPALYNDSSPPQPITTAVGGAYSGATGLEWYDGG